jgi:hypothetical protein
MAAQSNNDNTADALLEERMLPLDMLNNKDGVSSLEIASRTIDQMVHPIHPSSPHNRRGFETCSIPTSVLLTVGETK